MRQRHWLRQAITDDKGQFDVGNISLFVLMVIVLGAIPYMCALAALGKDPQPLGIAIGSVCGGFAAALGALGAYRRLADNGSGKPAA